MLLVILDDVGPELVSGYGLSPDAVDTPTLDALMARGVSYSRAWATPWCSTTRAAILTGQQPGRFGVGRAINLGVAGTWSMPLDVPTLPRRLRGADPSWSSGLSGKWHLTALSDGAETAALQAGFHHHYGAVGNLQINHAFDQRPQGYYNWERLEDGVVSRTTTYATTADIDDALRLSRELPSPWLVWIGMRAAHFPYQNPPEHLHSYGDVAGDAFLATRAILQAADAELGRLLASLDADGRLEETLVVILGDNGTTGSAQAGPWASHPGQKSTVYEAGVRIPLIVAGPGVERPGRVIHDLVHVIDLHPTVLEIAGVEPSREVDGISLWPGLRDETPRPRRDFLYTETFEPNGLGPPDRRVEALWDGRFKLIRGPDGDELYDLSDPGGHPAGLWLEEQDLLVLGDLTPEASEAYARLSERLDSGLEAPR